MSFLPQLEQMNLCVLEGQLGRAEDLLHDLVPSSSVEHRIVGHYRGIIASRRGEVARAKILFEDVLDKYGENVLLLKDLIVCQYQLQDMENFRVNLVRLERLLTEKESVLSSRSMLECELMMGKFLEEEARLAPALEFYNRAFTHSLNPQVKLRILIQRARWQALYQPNRELSALYRELISVPRAKLTQDLAIELEHSLMLMELSLVGSDHAMQRLLNLDARVPEEDRRLMYFDFVEIVLQQERQIPREVLQVVRELPNLDPYERFIAKFLDEDYEGDSCISDLTILSSQLPWASYLRLLCMAANLETRLSLRQELNRKIQLIVRGLDPLSQELWSRRLKQVLQTPEICIEYSAKRRLVAIQGREVDLAKKKIGLQLLNALAGKPDLSVDEAIRLLWQSDFSPEHYHRLRMSVHRLNMLIFEATGFGKILEVDSQQVRLRPEVRISRSEEANPALENNSIYLA